MRSFSKIRGFRSRHYISEKLKQNTGGAVNVVVKKGYLGDFRSWSLGDTRLSSRSFGYEGKVYLN